MTVHGKIFAASIFIVTVNFLVICLCHQEFNYDTLHRARRQLLFPNSTLFQFNVGVATPTPVKTVNINWAFQANFQLPWNRSQIPVDILEANTAYITEARKRRDLNENVANRADGEYESDASMYHFYQYVEDILNGYGHNGSSCVLKTLCQLGAEPLHTDMEDDLLHDLANFVLTPGGDAAEPHISPETISYIKAHSAGRDNQDCFSLYDRCSIPLLDIFSKMQELP